MSLISSLKLGGRGAALESEGEEEEERERRGEKGVLRVEKRSSGAGLRRGLEEPGSFASVGSKSVSSVRRSQHGQRDVMLRPLYNNY